MQSFEGSVDWTWRISLPGAHSWRWLINAGCWQEVSVPRRWPPPQGHMSVFPQNEWSKKGQGQKLQYVLWPGLKVTPCYFHIILLVPGTALSKVGGDLNTRWESAGSVLETWLPQLLKAEAPSLAEELGTELGRVSKQGRDLVSAVKNLMAWVVWSLSLSISMEYRYRQKGLVPALLLYYRTWKDPFLWGVISTCLS